MTNKLQILEQWLEQTKGMTLYRSMDDGPMFVSEDYVRHNVESHRDWARLEDISELKGVIDGYYYPVMLEAGHSGNDEPTSYFLASKES